MPIVCTFYNKYYCKEWGENQKDLSGSNLIIKGKNIFFTASPSNDVTWSTANKLKINWAVVVKCTQTIGVRIPLKSTYSFILTRKLFKYWVLVSHYIRVKVNCLQAATRRIKLKKKPGMSHLKSKNLRVYFLVMKKVWKSIFYFERQNSF